jgi:hypothetical protein
MWITIITGIVCLGLGLAGGYAFSKNAMGSELERNNLTTKLSALPYVILDFMSNSKFNSLTPDQRLEFVTTYFRKELKALYVSAYTPAQSALEDFFKRKRLTPNSPKLVGQA